MDFGSLLAQASGDPPANMMIVDKLARTPLSQIVIFAAVLTAVRLVSYPYLSKTPKHQRSGGYSFVKILNELADALIYAAIVVFMLVRPFGIQTFWIPSGSMIDTLRKNDYIVANKLIYRMSEPKVGDIVVFKPPSMILTPGSPETDYIKRLVGAPGDVIELKDKQLYRNGKAVDEPYVRYTDGDEVLSKEQADQRRIEDFKLINDDGRYVPVMMQSGIVNLSSPADFQVEPDKIQKYLEAKPVAIPPGYYLFMGDNRNGSYDSRYWGLVPRSSIIGRSEFVWLPFSRWKVTR